MIAVYYQQNRQPVKRNIQALAHRNFPVYHPLIILLLDLTDENLVLSLLNGLPASILM